MTIKSNKNQCCPQQHYNNTGMDVNMELKSFKPGFP